MGGSPWEVPRPKRMVRMSWKSGWVWCLHCGRFHKRGEEWVGKDRLFHCPYADCDGTGWDFFPWEEIRKQCRDRNIQVPDEPERGKVYDFAS